MQEFSIPDQNWSSFKKRIAKLNKRAEKLGCPLITISEVDILKQEKAVGSGTAINVYHVISISGETPKLAGWNFVATVEPGPDGNIIRSVPGIEVPEKYRTSPPECDHCHTARRRKEVFLVRNESGEYRQVGRQCLADFLGHTDPRNIAEYFRILQEAEEAALEYGAWDGQSNTWGLKGYLTYVAGCIRQWGWVSRTRARDDYRLLATADEAWYNMVKAQGPQRNFRPTPEDEALAEEVLKWGKGLAQQKDLSEYLWNLRTIALSEVVTPKTAGLAASMVVAYTTEKNKAVEAKTSEYFGQVGQRGEFLLTVTEDRRLESIYGLTILYKFVDSAGNMAVWFASNGVELKVGQTYRVRATVKAHEEYQGVKQTVLTRCKVLA